MIMIPTELLRALVTVADAVAAHTPRADTEYCCQLAMLHEDMHGEAFLYMRNALGYPAPEFLEDRADSSGPLPGDVEVPGRRFLLGADKATEHFVFDNEKWAHPVDVGSFRIARAPVTNVEFVARVNG